MGGWHLDISEALEQAQRDARRAQEVRRQRAAEVRQFLSGLGFEVDDQGDAAMLGKAISYRYRFGHDEVVFERRLAPLDEWIEAHRWSLEEACLQVRAQRAAV